MLYGWREKPQVHPCYSPGCVYDHAGVKFRTNGPVHPSPATLPWHFAPHTLPLRVPKQTQRVGCPTSCVAPAHPARAALGCSAPTVQGKDENTRLD